MMMTKPHHDHKWEAIVYSGDNRLVLSAPNNIIMDFFNTIAVENCLSKDKLIKYSIDNTLQYINSNWQDKTTVRIVNRLRHEQYVAIKAGLKDLPVIPETGTINSDSGSMEAKRKPNSVLKLSRSTGSVEKITKSAPVFSKSATMQKCVADHIIWRIKTNNISQLTALIMKWIVEDGLTKGELKTTIFDDVPHQLVDWRQKKFIKLYTFGDLPGEDQKLLLTSTNHGNLSNSIANCVDGSNKRANPQLVKRLANALRDKTMNCIYITHELGDALACLDGSGFRCAIVVNRSGKYSTVANVKDYSDRIKPLMEKGKLFICDTFDNIQFNPDPDGQSCC